MTIAAPDAGSASWGEDGAIFFSAPDGISSVPATGGSVSTVTKQDVAKRERHILPQALPGGTAILFTIMTTGWDTANVEL